jgi:hypothetical protein
MFGHLEDIMQPQKSTPKPSIAVDALLSGDLDDEISDEEANAEIEIPGAFPAPPQPKATAPSPPPASTGADDTTPSVRQAVNKAADVLRELRKGS